MSPTPCIHGSRLDLEKPAVQLGNTCASASAEQGNSRTAIRSVPMEKDDQIVNVQAIAVLSTPLDPNLLRVGRSGVENPLKADRATGYGSGKHNGDPYADYVKTRRSAESSGEDQLPGEPAAYKQICAADAGGSKAPEQLAAEQMSRPPSTSLLEVPVLTTNEVH